MLRSIDVQRSVLIFLGLLPLFSAAHARRFSKDKDSVRLEDVKALTFHKDRETTHRRIPALSQLSCVSGSGCQHYEPDSIRCVNSGSSYDAASIEWTCKASLPPEFKLGSTEVVCEGYDNPDDDFILKGSCALEYRLLLTDVGYEKLGSSTSGRTGEVGDQGAQLAAGLFWVIFGGVALWILYSLWKSIFRPDPNRPAWRDQNPRGWGGGWDDDGNDDPPPPYSPYRDSSSRPPQKSAPRSYQSRASSSRASSSRSTGGRAQQNQQRPWWQSFAAGAAAGGAAGYAAGNARGGQRQQAPFEQDQQRRSWFGGMAGPGNTGRTRPTSESRTSFGSPSSSPSFSETRYESTGFGGTRRR